MPKFTVPVSGIRLFNKYVFRWMPYKCGACIRTMSTEASGRNLSIGPIILLIGRCVFRHRHNGQVSDVSILCKLLKLFCLFYTIDIIYREIDELLICEKQIAKELADLQARSNAPQQMPPIDNSGKGKEASKNNRTSSRRATNKRPESK